jgi:phosphoribosylanthranilate isomerase
MPTPVIKICGITSAQALEAAIAARADWIGLVFVKRSPRYAPLEVAKELSKQAARRIGRVGLFIDADDRAILQAIDAAPLDVLQLHGEETPERVAQVKSRFGLPVWKALPVASPADLDRAEAYREDADLILFDAKTPAGSLPGGSGLVFDWNLLANHHRGYLWGLAGGLNPRNVAEALDITGAHLVDASSGVERGPGIKDSDKIAAFCQAARQQ